MDDLEVDKMGRVTKAMLIEENKKLKEELAKYKSMGRKKFNDESTIKLMYDLYIEGYSIKKIAEYLNSKDIKTATGKTWGKSSVHLILKTRMDTLAIDQYLKVMEQLESNKINKGKQK